jgi:hypothetical protein
MEATIARASWNPLEFRTLSLGFLLVGLAIAVTAVSYALNMTFSYQWLVWGVAAVFAAVALLALEWPRAVRRPGEVPGGRLRQLLLLSMPFAFVLSSQVCGLGTRACNTACHVINLSLIGLAAVTAIRLHRGRSVGAFLIPLVVVGLVPHCVCHAPINLIWHGMLGGVAPTCEMVPLAAALFAVSALRGVRPRSSTALVGAMFGVMVFIIVGGALFGFPWKGCAGQPR